MITLRGYQIDLVNEGYSKLLKLNMVYINLEPRVGKTLTALSLADKFINKKGVLFVTKKKAIKSIEKDFELLNPSYKLTVINYESLHKVTGEFDAFIIDEAHSIGTYPKPSKRYKDLKAIMKNNPYSKIIGISATPSPESYSQLFHQFRLSDIYSPFKKYANFYKWSKDFVNVTQRNLGYAKVNDYSDANKDQIMEVIGDYFVSYTQSEAGFNQQVNEHILEVEMNPKVYELVKRLKRDLVVEGKDEVILADTSVKLQNKIHQLCSGTVKFESGNSKIIDHSKAKFIKENFKGKKIAIFYIFKEEFNLLKGVFQNFTDSPEEFNQSDNKVFLGQIRSSREGVNLSSADALIYYNIEFSALSYIQGKDRMTSKERTKDNDVYFIFAKGGIEKHIYKRVSNKLDFTNNYFRKIL
ncbi:MAG: DEAD/DEAH box helicase family protein [Polaribacter sp.]|uniref:DEAD/DEAH box helicase family protein n=1 Tax=Polaribacter sp. TaxID=1920175 RepID=UPI003EF410EC